MSQPATQQHVPAVVQYNKESGRAIGHFYVSADGKGYFGHTTLLFTGAYWKTLSAEVQQGVWNKLRSFAGREWFVDEVFERQPGDRSLRFRSETLKAMKQEIGDYLIANGVKRPYDFTRDPTLSHYHTEMNRDVAAGVGVIPGAKFVFTPCCGYKHKELKFDARSTYDASE